MQFASLLAGFPKATIAFFTVNPLFCVQFEGEIQEYDVTGLFLYHFHLTHRKRNQAVFCYELIKRFAWILTTPGDLPKYLWGCRQDSRQVSKERQKEGQPVPRDTCQGGHHHFVDVSQSKCCPPWDGLWEGWWDDKRSSPRWVIPIPHTEEDSDPG